MSYKIIETSSIGKLVEVEIDDVKHRTIVVGSDSETDGIVDSFTETVKNPKTFTPDTTLQESGKTKLKNLGLTDEEITALIGK